MLFETTQQRLNTLKSNLKEWYSYWQNLYRESLAQGRLETQRYDFMIESVAQIEGALSLLEMIICSDLAEYEGYLYHYTRLKVRLEEEGTPISIVLSHLAPEGGFRHIEYHLRYYCEGLLIGRLTTLHSSYQLHYSADSSVVSMTEYSNDKVEQGIHDVKQWLEQTIALMNSYFGETI